MVTLHKQAFFLLSRCTPWRSHLSTLKLGVGGSARAACLDNRLFFCKHRSQFFTFDTISRMSVCNSSSRGLSVLIPSGMKDIKMGFILFPEKRHLYQQQPICFENRLDQTKPGTCFFHKGDKCDLWNPIRHAIFPKASNICFWDI